MADLFSEISKKTGISAEQAADALKNDDVKNVVADLGKKVGIDEGTTKGILDTASGAISDGVLDNIKNPFAK